MHIRHINALLLMTLLVLPAATSCNRSAADDKDADTDAHGETNTDSDAHGDSDSGISDFIGVDGINIVDGNGEPIMLRGVAFGNEVWFNNSVPRFHHQEVDFERVAAMGMNLVRFYLNTETYEDYATPYTYKDEGWEWLDKNIEWARNNGVHLFLNVHVPQGGFQSLGEGSALWEERELQLRFIAFWKELAARYKDEPVIAAYDLLNEPGTTESKEQWQTLAQEITDAIREVDTNHIIVVERVNSVDDDWTMDAEYNFVEVDDPAGKLVYQFHFYEPFDYTHQHAEWVNLGEGGKYPDPNVFNTNVSAEWVGEAYSVALPEGNSDWTLYEGTPVLAYEATANLAKPIFMTNNLDTGVAYLDNFEVVEIDADDNETVVLSVELESDANFWSWAQDGSGSYTLTADTVNDGTSVISATGFTSFASVGNNTYRFVPKLGHFYRIDAWMKGENIPAGAKVGMKLDFEHTDSPVNGRTKEMLEAELDKYIGWIHNKGVPAYLGEFGLYRACFEDGRGGLNWVTDMMDLLAERNCAFTYHTYHEDAFGIYRGTSGFPDPVNANTALIDLFTEKLK